MGVQINGSEGNVIATKGTYSGNVTIGGTLTYEDVTNIDSVGIITARSGIEIGASPGVGASISVDGNAIFSGITTATTLRAPTGIVTSLEATTGNITTLRAPTGIVTSFVTNTAKVGGGVTISESGIEASGIGITCANINGAQIGGRRNIVINGAMQIAQRGTSSTSDGYTTVDRFRVDDSGEDEACTREQVAVTSGGAYDSGFRNCLKITNGNQTSGAGSADYIQFAHRFEAQDLANSGWKFADSSSFITLSFWLKSSVAQAFSGSLRTHDGTEYSYKFDTPSLSANTWTKVIKTIPGNSNLTIADDNGLGMTFYLYAFLGTSFTTANSDTETWVTGTAGNYSNDMTTTWWTTNDATFEITGVQLEVGSQATPFEHRSFGEERLLCQRYYIKYVQQGCSGYIESNAGTTAQLTHTIPVPMRANPSTVCTTASSIGVERGGLYGINSTSGALSWMYENDLSIGWAMDTAKTRWHTTWCRVQNLELDAEL
jgi:hypothetical protein